MGWEEERKAFLWWCVCGGGWVCVCGCVCVLSGDYCLWEEGKKARAKPQEGEAIGFHLSWEPVAGQMMGSDGPRCPPEGADEMQTTPRPSKWASQKPTLQRFRGTPALCLLPAPRKSKSRGWLWEAHEGSPSFLKPPLLLLVTSFPYRRSSNLFAKKSNLILLQLL